jgi:hypothetical protein
MLSQGSGGVADKAADKVVAISKGSKKGRGAAAKGVKDGNQATPQAAAAPDGVKQQQGGAAGRKRARSTASGMKTLE